MMIAAIAELLADFLFQRLGDFVRQPKQDIAGFHDSLDNHEPLQAVSRADHLRERVHQTASGSLFVRKERAQLFTGRFFPVEAKLDVVL
jgi:hypothetical protein